MASANPSELQNALVIHTRPYQNSSLLVDFLTEKNGLLRCVAKGQRSKKNASVLSQFCVYQIAFTGKTDLKTLTQLEVANRRFLLKREALYSGFYINEVLLRVLYTYDPHPEVFSLCLNTLEALEKLNDLSEIAQGLEIILRSFEFNLLKDIGYLVDMQHDCHTGEIIDENIDYYFDGETGFYKPEAMNELNRKKFSGKTLKAIANNQLDDVLTADSNCKIQAKILSRLMLAPYLGKKPLHSKALFEKIIIENENRK
jgi:DNA repair protein RecO (recombination protein O)